MKQHILLVPMSSTAIGSVWPSRGSAPCQTWSRCSCSCALPFERRADPVAGASRSGRSADRSARRRALQQRGASRSPFPPAAPGAGRVLLRAAARRSVVEAEVPAPLPDPHRGGDALDSSGSVDQHLEQRGGVRRRVLADDHAQAAYSLEPLSSRRRSPRPRGRSGAASVVLPQRERLPLDHTDVERVGEHALDARRARPRPAAPAARALARCRRRASAIRRRCRRRAGRLGASPPRPSTRTSATPRPSSALTSAAPSDCLRRRR